MARRKIKLHLCSECGAGFKNLVSLRTHSGWHRRKRKMNRQNGELAKAKKEIERLRKIVDEFRDKVEKLNSEKLEFAKWQREEFEKRVGLKGTVKMLLLYLGMRQAAVGRMPPPGKVEGYSWGELTGGMASAYVEMETLIQNNTEIRALLDEGVKK